MSLLQFRVAAIIHIWVLGSSKASVLLAPIMFSELAAAAVKLAVAPVLLYVIVEKLTIIMVLANCLTVRGVGNTLNFCNQVLFFSTQPSRVKFISTSGGPIVTFICSNS